MTGSRMKGIMLVGVLLVAGCSDRNTPSAPVSGPLAAKSGGDRISYTWQLSCTGDGGSYAKWSWTTAGATTGTGSATCYPGSGGGSTGGPDPRPADADGFTASVNGNPPKTWTVVPGGAFSVQLKGTRTWYDINYCFFDHNGRSSCEQSATGTLRIDS